MGCCCSSGNVRPKLVPESKVWRVSQVFGCRQVGNSFKRGFSYSAGITYISQNMLCYDASCVGQLRIPLGEIKSLKTDTAFRDSRQLKAPCYCGCQGCGDGIVDITGTIAAQNLEFHIGFCALNHETMFRDLQGILGPHIPS